MCLALALLLLTACGDRPRAGLSPVAGTKGGTGVNSMEKIRKRGEIVFGVKFDTPPFGSIGQGRTEPEGFEIDLVTEVAKRLTVRPKFVEVNPKNRVANLDSGKIDVITATMIATRARDKAIDFSEPYFEDDQRLMVRGDSEIARSGYFDIEEDRRYLEYETANQRIVDCGDVDIIYSNPEQTFKNITHSTAQILEAGAVPIVLGGEHSVTYGVVRAYEEPICVVHFDAHLDYRPFIHGAQHGNGSPMLKIGKLPNVEKIVQIGSRGMRAAQDDLAESRANGNDVFTMKGFRKAGVDHVLTTLPKGRKVYISVDIDVLDMPLVPGCASAEADGMSYEELRQTIFAIVREHELVGFDVVEINPMLDVASNVTSQLGAQLAIETMARAVENPGYLHRKGRLS
ncbi:arginase family protein [Nonomuraea diastatica]|uniref:Transporter substrate-binding domain-containing protein n=1 Tax=Nonomuraea diastatica TaxID=1848329 RepID=A0A4R4X1U5_9ACTN|nr:arginase family protein [Nonomuraea diastatica]TDD24149.1 transporter substrate-binding domain-containing protein [Nonomuraea diastatica]